MFCPKCSQSSATESTQFCSKCGFNLKGVRNLIEGKESENTISNRQKGIRQGSKLILLSLVLYPAFVLLSALFPPNDVLLESSPSTTLFEQIGWAILWTICLSGVARIFYSLIFERNSASIDNEIKQTGQINSNEAKAALPPQQSTPVSDFGRWKTTEELFEPVFTKPKTSGELK